MITLYGFGPAFNLPDPSPFVTKIDLTLRVAGLDYQCKHDANNLQKAPKAKLPFIEDNGTIIADSVFITDHLKKQHNVDIDINLSDEQRAQAQLINKSLDENLYWVIVYSRWVRDDVWDTVKAQFFNDLPYPMNKLIAWYARSSVKKQIMGHGLTRHSDDEITEIAHKSWASLSTLLGDKPYFFGDKISSLDITAFAMLSGFTLSSLDTALNQQIKSYDNLVNFTHRIAKEYYPNEITL